MMKVTVVLLIFSIVLSSGPTPSPECMQARSNITMDCRLAYFSMIAWENATDDQAMMVCNATRTCNGMLESVINACSDSQSRESQASDSQSTDMVSFNYSDAIPGNKLTNYI